MPSHRSNHLTIALIVALAAAIPAWLVAWRLVVSREVELTLTPRGAGPTWSLEWTDAKTGRANGSWIDLRREAPPARSTLEIASDARPAEPGRTFRLWLYEVKPLAPDAAPLDLKAAIADASRASGRWVAFDQGPGIVLEGPDPGRLALDLPAGGAELAYALTQDGGGFSARLDGDDTALDCFAATQEGRRTTIGPRGPRSGVPITISRRIPASRLASLRLHWWDAPSGAHASVEGRVATRLLGWSIRREALALESDATGSGAMESKEGSLAIRPPGGLSPAVHAAGVLAFAGVLALGAVAMLAGVWMARAGPARWLTLDRIALALVIAAHAYLAVATPVLYCPDSPDYLVGMIKFVETGRLDHFGAVRVPGYALVVAPLWMLFSAGGSFNAALGAAQGAMVILSAIMARGMARRLLPAPWPAITLLVVALSPGLVLWGRIAMSEAFSAFLGTLIAYAAVAIFHQAPAARQARVRGGPVAHLAGAVLVGVLAGAGAYTRGNFQVFVVLAPVIIGLMLLARCGVVWSGIVAGLALGVGAASLTPRILHNQRTYGVASFMVGAGYQQGVTTQYNRVMDLNQTGVFDEPAYRRIIADRAAGRASEYDTIAEFARSERIQVPRARDDWGIKDAKSLVAVRESYARRPERRLFRGVLGFASVTGLFPYFRNPRHGAELALPDDAGRVGTRWIVQPSYAETEYWTRPLRGEGVRGTSNHFAGPEHFAHFGEHATRVFDRTQRDIGPYLHGTTARVLDHAFGADQLARPILAALALLAIPIAIARREWIAAWAGAVVALHALAVAWMAMSGIDRYGVPFDPLQRLAAVYALARIVAWSRRARAS